MWHEVREDNCVIKMGSSALGMWGDWLKEWDWMKSLAKVLEISEKEFPMISTRISINSSDRLGFDNWPYPKSIMSLMRMNCTVLIKQRVIMTVDCKAPLHRTVTPYFAFKYTDLRDGRTRSWNFEKFELSRHQFRVPFDSLHSWLISASKECLKSDFDRERKEKSHLELQFHLRKCRMKSHASGD